ncbi:hypothetical protein HK097_006485, partial [Rhizophlyctis rosea]
MEIAQIVDMGFSAASAQAALEATNYDLSAAIDMLVQDRDAGRQLGRETPRSRQMSAQPPTRAARNRVDWTDNDDDDDSIGGYGRIGEDPSAFESSHNERKRPPPSQRWTDQDGGEQDGRGGGQQQQLNREQLVTAASALGKSVFSNAKNVLAFSKKKLEEAVEKAQEHIEQVREMRDEDPRAQGWGKQGGRGGRDRRQEEPAGWREDAPARYRDDSSDEEEGPVRRTTGEQGVDGRENKFASYFAKADAAGGEVSSSDDESPRPDPQARYEASVRVHGQRTSSPVRPGSAQTPQSYRSTTSPFQQSATTPQQPKSQPPRPKTPPPPAVTATPSQLQTSETHKTTGNTLFKQGQFADAEASYSLAIQSLPTGHLSLIPLHNNRAAARLKTGHYKEAIED